MPARRYIAENQIRYTEALLAQSPRDLGLRRELILSLFAAATPQGFPLAENAGDRKLAVKNFDRALRLASALARESTAPDDRMNLAHALNYSGWMQAAAGDLSGAAKMFERAIATNTHAESGSDSRARVLALSLSRLAWVRSEQGEHGQSAALHDRALRIRRRAHNRDRSSRREQRGLSIALDLYGDSLEAAGRHDEVLQTRRKTLQLEEALLQLEPASIETGYHAARALLRTGQAEALLGVPGARDRIVKAAELLRRNRSLEPQSQRSRELLSEADAALVRVTSPAASR